MYRAAIAIPGVLRPRGLPCIGKRIKGTGLQTFTARKAVRPKKGLFIQSLHCLSGAGLNAGTATGACLPVYAYLKNAHFLQHPGQQPKRTNRITMGPVKKQT